MADWGNLLRQVVKIGSGLLAGGNRSRNGQPGNAQPRNAQPRNGQSRSGQRAAGSEHPPQERAGARSAPTAERARTVVYAPQLDGAADPGEIVWAWVPYEENDGRGKDRPLLVVGRGGADLLGLMLSSQHDRADDVNWVSVGAGAWDRQGRESFVRLDRVLEVGEHDIRREGAVLDRDRFERVAAQLRERYGWG